MDAIRLLLFDVVMPKVNGVDAYLEIKKIRPDIKTIFISGFNNNAIQENTLDFRGRHELFDHKKGFIITEYKNSNCCIAHAKAPGYETYTTGWHSLIIQKM